jgi:pimeloyl-ACP methyl ester carboxylesterase
MSFGIAEGNLQQSTNYLKMNSTFEKTFTHHTTQVNGVRLHYAIAGKGDPVVLLHGWSVTWYEWCKIMPALGDRVQTMLQSVATNVRGGAIEKCGHFIADEQPDLLVERLFAFFEEVS